MSRHVEQSSVTDLSAHLRVERRPIEDHIKLIFFASNGFFDCFLFRADFGKDIAHRPRNNIDKFEEEGFMKSQRTAITDRPTQYATQNVAAAFVRWNDLIGNGKAQRTNVIG